jgi:hypothetical protein
MATTTNYGWTTPDDTALVKDGAAAIRTLGSSVDTTTKALNPSTTLGDIEYRSSTANTNTRLGLGTAGQLLQVNSGANAPEWATVSTGGMTLISTTTLSGSSVTLSSIPQTYNDLVVVIRNYLPSSDDGQIWMRINSDSGTRYANITTLSVISSASTFTDSVFIVQPSADNAVTQNFGKIQLFDYKNTTTWKSIETNSISTDATTNTSYRYSTYFGVYNQIPAISSLLFIASSGTFTSGTILLYGVK